MSSAIAGFSSARRACEKEALDRERREKAQAANMAKQQKQDEERAAKAASGGASPQCIHMIFNLDLQAHPSVATCKDVAAEAPDYAKPWVAQGCMSLESAANTAPAKLNMLLFKGGLQK